MVAQDSGCLAIFILAIILRGRSREFQIRVISLIACLLHAAHSPIPGTRPAPCHSPGTGQGAG